MGKPLTEVSREKDVSQEEISGPWCLGSPGSRLQSQLCQMFSYQKKCASAPPICLLQSPKCAASKMNAETALAAFPTHPREREANRSLYPPCGFANGLLLMSK